MKQTPLIAIIGALALAALNIACGGDSETRGSGLTVPTIPPLISSATGDAIANNDITINGSSFGTKSSAAPVIWETFEMGPAGASIANNGWVAYSPPEAPTYSSNNPYSGALAGYQRLPASSPEDFDTAGKRGLNNATEVYVSYYFRYVSTAGAGATPSPFIKLLRINGPGEFYRSCPSMVASLDTETARFYQGVTNTIGASGCGDGIWIDNDRRPAEDSWTRIEHYLRLSTPAGAANGASLTWTNLRLTAALRDIVSRDTAVADRGYDSVLLPFMGSNKTGWQYDIFVDDLYVDTTPARIEVGNAATVDACTIREVQPPTAWADGSVSFRYHPGRLPSTGELYVYVTNSGGLTNAQGYRLR